MIPCVKYPFCRFYLLRYSQFSVRRPNSRFLNSNVVCVSEHCSTEIRLIASKYLFLLWRYDVKFKYKKLIFLFISKSLFFWKFTFLKFKLEIKLFLWISELRGSKWCQNEILNPVYESGFNSNSTKLVFTCRMIQIFLTYLLTQLPSWKHKNCLKTIGEIDGVKPIQF